MEKKLMIRNLILVFLILSTAFLRVLPHPLNVAPVGAISLFGAAYFKKNWQIYLLPLLAVFLSDLYLNNVVYSKFFNHTFIWFYKGFYWVYGSYILTSIWGIYLYKKVNVQRVVVGALGSVTIFFMVSNFGVWLNGSLYSSNWSGLLNCYINALPFLKNSLLGDIIYTSILFGVFELLKIKLKLGVVKPISVPNN